ncbi:MAG: NAD(P)/FAD-dependent oxidoreductase [Actinomycetota bacterium]|nr:NAD(P)/FAD-dependent oxidoreductase [Actinomycetota bacterium]
MHHRLTTTPRVVIVGAGFAGLAAARELRDAPVDVVLIDANNFHTFQPLLYQVATAGLDADDVSFPVRGIVRRRRRRSNVAVRMARVTAVDLTARTVTLDGRETLAYDALVLASGAVTDDFGIPGVTEHAFALKHLDDALALRAHVLDAFERAAADPTAVGDGGIDVVVCGGGPTGVEMAGGLAELYTRVLAKDFPQLPVRAARIVLVEMADRLLTPFHPSSSQRALRTLRRRGVDVRLGVGVARIERDCVELTDGSTIRAHTAVWATGVGAEGLAATSGMSTGRGGRLVVESDLSLPSHPEVFAVGDIAAAVGSDGVPLPQVAQPAIQGGRHAARQILGDLDGRARQPFVYRDKGQMATIGRHDAVAEFPNGWRIGGPLGWLAWLGLHLVYLLGFRNRVNVLVNWGWNYLTYDRGSRILRESERSTHTAKKTDSHRGSRR